MVRDGKMEREEALRQEETIGFMDDELKQILKKDMNLRDAEIAKYFGV